MKKALSTILVLSLLFGCFGTLAEDLEIQVIDPNKGNYDPLSLDNCQLGKKYTIDGYADI